MFLGICLCRSFSQKKSSRKKIYTNERMRVRIKINFDPVYEEIKLN